MLRAVRTKLGALVSYPGNLESLRKAGGENAVQLARYLRRARIWAVLQVGSVLILVAAVIQLALAYQGPSA